MISRLLLLCLLLPFALSTAEAQVGQWAKNRMKRFLSDAVDPAQPQFIMYPTLAYAPETGLELGLSSLFLYYANKDTLNRLSEVSAFTFVTLEKQYGFWLDHALYTQHNKWFLLGKFRAQHFPLLYYGIGPDTPESPQAVVDANTLLLRERFLRKVKGSFYMGLEADFQQLSQVTFERSPELAHLPEPVGSQGSRNMGVGVGLVYDNRHNVLNVRQGLFAETGFLRYHPTWGSDFDFTSYFFDSRVFRPARANQVLAAQVYGLFNTGTAPFNQLAMMGGEGIMRGYYTGRFRDKNYVASQVEYRWLPFPFSKRVGGAVFVSAGNVAPEIGSFALDHTKIAGGGGLRYLLFPKKDIFTRLDFAVTKEGTGFYFFIGEAF